MLIENIEMNRICIGASPLGSSPELYGYEVSMELAEQTVEAVFKSSINFLDTSNNYGAGRSETAIGNVIKRNGGLPEDFLLATKVDANQSTHDFSAARVRESLEESLSRLNLDHIPILFFHDPDHHISFEEAVAKNGPIEELVKMKAEGIVGNIGIATYPIDLMTRYVETGLMDIVLSHNRFTLLDRSAYPLMELCESVGIPFLNAAPFGGGFLANENFFPTYSYRKATPAFQEAKNALISLCKEYSLSLALLALHWSLREPLVASTIIGTANVARVASIEADSKVKVPEEIWTRVEEVLASFDLTL